MKRKSSLLIFAIVGLTSVLAARECWERGQRDLLQSILAGSCAYTWLPERMARHRLESAPIVRQYHVASQRWFVAGWTLIGCNGLLLIPFTRALGYQRP